MSTSDNSSKCSGSGDYLTKQVLLNGQFVTLYSLNGHTWLSSPEDIPALMERLDNERIALFNGEKGPQAESPKEKEGEKSADKSNATPSTKYRMKGPKPRPILEQNGKVFKGPSLEPVSASNTVMKFSSDLPESEVLPKSKTKGKALSKTKVKKLLAEVTDIPKKAKKSVPPKKAAGKTKKVRGEKKEASNAKMKKGATNTRVPTRASRKASSVKATKAEGKKSKDKKKVTSKTATKVGSKVSALKKSKSGASPRAKTSKKPSSKKPAQSNPRSSRKPTSKRGKTK